MEDQLIRPALFAAMREAWPLPVAVPTALGEYLARCRALLERRMEVVNAQAAADKLMPLHQAPRHLIPSGLCRIPRPQPCAVRQSTMGAGRFRSGADA